MAIMALAVLSDSASADIVWDVHTPIWGGKINSPVDNGVYLCGASVDCSCSRGSDIDHWCDTATGQEGFPADAMSTSYPFWTATAGTWKYGDNTGTSIVWIAPNTATTHITLKVYDNDLPNSIPWFSGTRDDAVAIQDQATSVQAIIPDCNTVDYGGANHSIDGVTVPEYDRAARRDDPAVWTISADATATVTFWASTDLSQPEENITVRGETSGDGHNIGDWGNNTGNTFGTEWPTSNMTCISEWDIDDAVQWQAYTTNWTYKCVAGSNTWIHTLANPDQSTKLYVVWGTPVGSHTAEVYELSCDYCWGCDKSLFDPEDAEDICDEVLAGIAGDYTYNGTCAYDSSNFVHLIGAQGVSGTCHRWSTDYPAFSSGDIDAIQTREIDPIGTPAAGRYAWANYHQWATAAGYNWDASCNEKRAGSWGDYEDWLFNDGGTDDYRLYPTSTWFANPSGQAAGDHPGMTHTTPAPEVFTAP